MRKKDYQKPFLVSESFCASEYIASCDYRATPGGTKPANIYHDVNSDGKYATDEEVSYFLMIIIHRICNFACPNYTPLPILCHPSKRLGV